MATMKVMGRAGHTTVAWPDAPEELATGAGEAAVKEAERIFGEHMAKGAKAFAGPDRNALEEVRKFDPHSENLIIVPPMAGGAV